MRKLTSMAIVLALVLCLATVTFAANGTESDPYTSFGPTLTIPAGETVVFQLAPSDETVTITDANNEISVLSPYGMSCGTANADGSLTVSLAQNCAGGCVLYFSSSATEDKTYSIGAVNVGSGTESDPYTAFGATLTIPAGQTVHFQLSPSEEVVTIIDANNEINVVSPYGMSCGTANADGSLTVSLAQNCAGGCVLAFTSTATEDKTYTVSTEQPAVEGSRDNPYSISALPYEGSAVIAEGTTGVYYKYECQETGRYFVEIDAENAANGWEYQLIGEWDGSEYKWGDTQCSVDGSASDYMDLDAGDVLVIYVNTYGRSYYEGSTTLYDVTHPAGTVGFDVSYAAMGSEQVPYDLTYVTFKYIEEGDAGVWFELNSEEGHMLSMVANGMTVKVDGVAQTPDEDGVIVAFVEAGVHTVQVINTGVEEPYFDCTVYTKGTADYPYDAVLGETVQNESAFTSSGKVYAYTAPIDGTITLVMDPDGDWYYEISNTTAKIHYGPFTSADETVKSTYSLHVAAGEEVLIYIQQGAEDSFLMEDASITFEMWFKGDKEGSLGNAINVNVPADLTGIDAAAGADVYYNISSQLNGQLLTIVGDDDIVVTLNGVALESDNGVFVVELTGAPTNSLIVSNKGDKDASYIASIAWPEGTEGNPNPITATGEYTATVGAGEEVFYAVNAKLDGATLTVNGASYIIVNGTKIEAKDGVASAELKASGATISLVVGNAGTADASVKINVEMVENDNPKTGDAGMLMPVVAALVSVMGAAMLVIKKKEN